jgi:hypothetical protein
MNQSIEGIVPYQVFQRDENNTARIPFSGRLSEPVEGQIEAQITKGSTIVLDWQNVGKASGESFVGEITGVPTGGEYTLTLRFQTSKKRSSAICWWAICG